jgi:hypothetical protein
MRHFSELCSEFLNVHLVFPVRLCSISVWAYCSYNETAHFSEAPTFIINCYDLAHVLPACPQPIWISSTAEEASHVCSSYEDKGKLGEGDLGYFKGYVF